MGIEYLVNQALDAIGYPKHVGYIYEGSPAARVALEVYGQTRDELLQAGDWPFALREVALVTNGQTPPTPWAYEYGYPSDCLRIRYVRPGPLTGGTTDNDPQPILYRPFSDNRPTPNLRAILSQTASAVLIYTGKVTNPSLWEPEFTRVLIALLAEKFSFMLAGSADMAKARVALAQRNIAEGMAVDDMSPPRGGMQVNGQ